MKKLELDNVVKEYQSYIIDELMVVREPDTTKIACYIQAIIVINNKFDTNYATNLEYYENKSRENSFMNILKK